MRGGERERDKVVANPGNRDRVHVSCVVGRAWWVVRGAWRAIDCTVHGARSMAPCVARSMARWTKQLFIKEIKEKTKENKRNKKKHKRTRKQ